MDGEVTNLCKKARLGTHICFISFIDWRAFLPGKHILRRISFRKGGNKRQKEVSVHWWSEGGGGKVVRLLNSERAYPHTLIRVKYGTEA